MSTLVIYKNGKILKTVQGNSESIADAQQQTNEQHIIVNESVDHIAHYVDISVDAPTIKKIPQQPSEGYVFNYATGAWGLDIALARSKKWIAIKAARQAQEHGSFDWNAHSFQCNEISQMRIQAAVQAAIIDDGISMVWTLTDNTTQTFNATELRQIGKALSDHVKECHDRGRMLRAQIDAATTQEELEAIVW